MLNIRSLRSQRKSLSNYVTIFRYYWWLMQLLVLFNRGYFGVVLSKNSCGSSVAQRIQRCTWLNHFSGSSAIFSQIYPIFWFNVGIYALMYTCSLHAMMLMTLCWILRNVLILLCNLCLGTTVQTNTMLYWYLHLYL